MNWYLRLVASHPCVIIFVVGIFSVVALIISVTASKLPDFSDPQLGFETRGTEIAKRLIAWENLYEAARPSGILTVNPLANREPSPPLSADDDVFLGEISSFQKRKNKSNATHLFSETNNTKQKLNNKVWASDNWFSLEMDEKDVFFQDHDHEHISSDGFFCDGLSPDFSHAVLEAVDFSHSLFSLDALTSICLIQNRFMDNKMMSSICQTVSTGRCCNPWSLPNYISLLLNRTSCSDLTEKDVEMVKILLFECAKYYNNLQLRPDCYENSLCHGVPVKCTKYNAVYNILYYLTDVDFLPTNYSHSHQDLFLNNTMIFLPIARSSAILPFYYNLTSSSLRHKNVQVVAMDLGLKNALFNDCLMRDAFFMIAGSAFMVLCIWSYTNSLFITLSTVLAIVMSLVGAYFIYTFIFKIKFFPFMNFLAIVVAIGIGADDAFIFYKMWEFSKVEKINYPVLKLLSDTLKHSSASMFVTSLTTAAAFFSSYVSPITAINCFRPAHPSRVREAIKDFQPGWSSAIDVGPLPRAATESVSPRDSDILVLLIYIFTYSFFCIFERKQRGEMFLQKIIIKLVIFLQSVFAGTAVFANFLLMITWLPACFVISQKPYCLTFLPQWKPEISNRIRTAREHSSQVKALLHRGLLLTIIRLKWLWLFLLAAVAVSSAVVVLYYPKLRLPDSKNFHLFQSSHLFERYDAKYRDKFWFERLEKVGGWDNTNFKLPLRFVWGVLPIDNGNHLEPNSKGTLEFDPTFDMAAPESQKWLLTFCQVLRAQPFYQLTLGPLLPNCFIESFENWMQRRCRDIIDDIDRSPCCESSKFPYSRDVFQMCIVKAIASLYETPADYFLPGVAGPKFSKNTDEIKAVVVEYDSNHSYSMSFADMHKFYTEVESWFQRQLSTAPPGMKNGWFVSHLDFYDLQLALTDGTAVAIGVSMAISLAVFFLVSLNVLISIYTIITISCVIFVTVAVLVLIGWSLNILESVVVTTAIGLAVDFSLHYGLNYRFSMENSRESAVSLTLTKMGGPTLMAALTTGAAGLFMLPSSVLAYIQVGIFLIVVMASSWLYSTVFLMSLLTVAGPRKGFGQYSYKAMFFFGQEKSVNSPAESNKTLYTNVPSDSVLSSSSITEGSLATHLSANEAHELEALTRGSKKVKCAGPVSVPKNSLVNMANHNIE